MIMLNKSEKLILIGKSGSGKNYLLNKLKDLGLKISLKITTRPMRLNESDGVDYNFINEDSFDKLVESNQLIVYQDFYNNKGEIWKYGILSEDFNNSQLFIMTPGEIKQMPIEIRKKCFVVYLDIDRQIRENRLFHRNDTNDSIIRRLDSDEKDFNNFKDYDLRITDPEFDPDSVLSLMY